MACAIFINQLAKLRVLIFTCHSSSRLSLKIEAGAISSLKKIIKNANKIFYGKYHTFKMKYLKAVSQIYVSLPRK